MHRQTSASDREVVAFLAAGFAWGNVKAIHAAIERLLAVLGPSPAAAIAEHPPSYWRGPTQRIVHRRIHGADVAYLLGLLGCAYRTHGSLEALWTSCDDATEPTVAPAIPGFLAALASFPVEAPDRRGRAVSGGTLRRGVGLAPFGYAVCGAGSAYKRMNLFLRWMARPADGIDLGLWGRVGAARLVVPLDVHVLRAARALGLTRRSDASMRTALEVTAALRSIDPADPVRFDFALVRAGMEAARVSPARSRTS